MKKKILVVENDKDILDIISFILTEEGYDPILCATETGVIQMIDQIMPDMIILDIIKPTALGTELCRAIKASKTTGHIPVIVLSTHPGIGHVKEVCADEVLKKPFDVPVLLDVVKAQLAA